jgi:hypothetical protein
MALTLRVEQARGVRVERVAGSRAAGAMTRDPRLCTDPWTDEDAPTIAVVAPAMTYGPYGYPTNHRNVAGGRQVGRYRVQHISRREGLKVPAKQGPRGRLWLHDGSSPLARG